MKLTLALGLQYDNNGSAIVFSSMPTEQTNRLDSVAQLEPVIDVNISSEISSQFEFSKHHGVFFLTYNLQGQPNPVTNDAVRIDMFA